MKKDLVWMLNMLMIIGCMLVALGIGGYIAWLMLSNTHAREKAYKRHLEAKEQELALQANQLEMLRRQGF